MVPALMAIFGIGAAAALTLARIQDRPWLWGMAFVNLLIAFYEISFVLQPAAEWIRTDLLLSVPLFTLGNLFLAWYGQRQCPGWWVAVLAVAALAAPAWVAGVRY
jgi:hypothetical protein